VILHLNLHLQADVPPMVELLDRMFQQDPQTSLTVHVMGGTMAENEECPAQVLLVRRLKPALKIETAKHVPRMPEGLGA